MGEPHVSTCPEAVNTFAQAERELLACESTYIAEDKCSGMAGKLFACSRSLLSFISFSSQC